MRECIGCHQVLPFDKFDRRTGRDPSKGSGYQARCVPCRQQHQRSHRQENLEQMRAYDRERYRSDPARRQPHPRNPLATFKYHLKRDYGMTLADYAELLARSGGMCAICGKPPKRPVVDHDHKTGKPRGILCGNCNCGIGLLGEDVKTILAAVDYLEKHKAA